MAVVLLGLIPLTLTAWEYKLYPHHKGSTSLAEGTRTTHDILLYHMDIKTDSNHIPKTLQTKNICFPDGTDKQQVEFTVTEYSIKAVDEGGLVYLKKGTGLEKKKVCFHVKSKRGQGYHFDIDVWGRYLEQQLQ